MVWFTVDDGLTTNPKVLSIPRSERMAVMGLWTFAGAWCSQHLTDGVVPAFMLEEWGADVSHGTALVDAKLWARCASGYKFLHWDEYQRSRDEVEAKRKAERDRKAAYRAKRAGQSASGPNGTDDGTPTGHDVGRDADSATPFPTQPSPTQPYQLKKGDRPAERGSRVPEDFAPDDAMRAWAAENTPAVNVDRETTVFVNFWAAKSGRDAVKVDWRRTWQNWLIKAQGFAERDGWKPQAVPLRDVTAELQAAQKAKWCEEHGVTVEEYDRREAANDVEWIRSLRGDVA